MQLKTIEYEVDDSEKQRLEEYLQANFGSVLTPTSVFPFQTTNAGSRDSGKRVYAAAVPMSYPLGAEQWVVDLQRKRG